MFPVYSASHNVCLAFSLMPDVNTCRSCSYVLTKLSIQWIPQVLFWGEYNPVTERQGRLRIRKQLSCRRVTCFLRVTVPHVLGPLTWQKKHSVSISYRWNTFKLVTQILGADVELLILPFKNVFSNVQVRG